MVLQAIQPRLHDIVSEMASTVKSIPLKGGVESLGNVATAIGDNSREAHMQLEQTGLLHSKPSNDCTYTTTQQLGNVLRRWEIQSMTKACTEYTHLDGKLSHPTPYTIPAPDDAFPNRGLAEYL